MAHADAQLAVVNARADRVRAALFFAVELGAQCEVLALRELKVVVAARRARQMTR